MAFSIFLILCIFYFSTCVFPDPRRARMRLLMRVMSPVTQERKGFISMRLQWRGQSHQGALPALQKMLTTLKQLYFFYISIFLNPEIEEVLGVAPFQRTETWKELELPSSSFLKEIFGFSMYREAKLLIC